LSTWKKNKEKIFKQFADITGTQDEEDKEDEEDDDDKDEDNLSRLTAEQVRLAITVLEDLSIFSKFGEEMLASLKDLNKNIKRDYDDTCKQSIITDFFSKNLSKKQLKRTVFVFHQPRTPNK